MLSVREDFLGIYEYDARGLFADEQAINRATIRLYWGVIGLVSEWLGCRIEDLAIVVLAHELAHAYTQLGADIDGRRWAAPSFAKAETALKEGLDRALQLRRRRREQRETKEQRPDRAIAAGQPICKRSNRSLYQPPLSRIRGDDGKWLRVTLESPINSDRVRRASAE